MHSEARQSHSLHRRPQPSLALCLFHIIKNFPATPHDQLNSPSTTCHSSLVSRIIPCTCPAHSSATSSSSSLSLELLHSHLSPRTLWPLPSQQKYNLLWTKEHLPVLSATQQGSQSRRTRAQTVSGGEESMVMPQFLTLDSNNTAQHEHPRETLFPDLSTEPLFYFSLLLPKVLYVHFQ